MEPPINIKHLVREDLNRRNLIMLSLPIMLFLLVSLMYLVGCGKTSDDGKSLYESKCDTCHSLKIVDDANYSGSQWEAVVKDMQSKTTAISDDEAAKITEYLENR